MIEGDVYSTKDQKLVMIHDRNLKRLCNKDVDITNLNSSEFPHFRKDIGVDFSDDKYYSNEENIRYKPSLLEDILKKYQHEEVYFIIEIKSGKVADLKLGLEMIRKLGLQEKVFFGILKKSNAKLKKDLGDFNCFMDLRNALLILFSFLFGKFKYNINKKVFWSLFLSQEKLIVSL